MKTEPATGWSVLVTSQDGRKFLAVGNGAMSFFTTKFQEARDFSVGLKEHGIKRCRPVRATMQITIEHNGGPQP